MTALMKAVIEAPKRDNTDYHLAIGEVRRAFAEVDATLGPDVLVKMKRRWKKNGDYVVKMSFRKKVPDD